MFVVVIVVVVLRGGGGGGAEDEKLFINDLLTENGFGLTFTTRFTDRFATCSETALRLNLYDGRLIGILATG